MILSVHSSVAWITFTLWCNCHHHPCPALFPHTKQKLHSHWTASPVPKDPKPKPLVYFLHGRDLLHTSFKWNHRKCVLLCMTYFTEHNVFRVHPCCSICQNFLFMTELYSIVGLHHILFIHSPINGLTGCSHFLAMWIMLLWTMMYEYLFKSPLLILLGNTQKWNCWIIQ